MNAHPPRLDFRRLLQSVSASAALLVPAFAIAQTADSPPPAKSRDQVVTLTPFDVTADSDKSYGALNSNSITAFNTQLDHLPISADIFTNQFIRDTDVNTVEDLVSTYSAGAGMGAAAGDPSGSTAPQVGDRGSAYQGLELRGLGSTVTKQDGFMNPAQTGVGINSLFGLERVEIINGPQALLYGNGGAGGVINLISKQARLNQPRLRLVSLSGRPIWRQGRRVQLRGQRGQCCGHLLLDRPGNRQLPRVHRRPVARLLHPNRR